MFASCLYCHSYLGSNELHPRFRVGKRLAFDSSKGRLWVICGHCARWNLSPLEERWEAIDECERQFRKTRIRVSTDNIGLAELRSGLTLIRIGRPLWPEFAAWRYGRRFSRRRMKSGLAAGTIVTGFVGATVGAAVAGFVGAAYTAVYLTGIWLGDEGHKRRPVTSVKLGDKLYRLTQDDAEATRVFEDNRPGEYGVSFHHSSGVQLLRGADARRVLGHVIPALTPFGGRREQVTGAIDIIDRAGNAEECIGDTLKVATRQAGFFTDLPVEMRLALEMSLQEDGERRALDGELAVLEAAWREAEQIASISDSLLVPVDVLERIAGLRKGIRSPGFAFH